MTLEQAKEQASQELAERHAGEIVGRADEIFAGQLTDLRNNLADRRREVEAMQVELDALEAQVAPAEETEETGEEVTEPQG